MSQAMPQWATGTNIGGGRFRIEKVLGSGGAGIVYLARHVELNYLVAIKVSTALDTTSLANLREEAQILLPLRHDHLPRVTDLFVEGRLPCLVMEYIDGSDLDHMGGKVAEADAIRWITEVARALTYLHEQPQPIIHRDVKPANIRLRQNGQAVLVDFGIAKIGGAETRTRAMAQGYGTPPFAPPEQYGGTTGPYTDVYALGATLYTLINGEPPPESVTRSASAEQLTLSAASPAVAQIIATAMAIPIGQRYPSAREMHAQLQALESGKLGTQVLETYLHCPACGARQSVPNATFCQQCGVRIVLRFPQTGRLLTHVQELAAACDAEWDAAVEHLSSGRLTQWLEARSEREFIARAAEAQAQSPGDSALALERLLRPGAPADLAADRAELDLGAFAPEQPGSATLALRRGAGYIAGSIEVVGDWLAVTPAAFRARPGEQIPQIVARVKPAWLTPGDTEQQLSARVRVVTNRGTIEIPAHAVVRNPPRPDVQPQQISLGRADARQRLDGRAVIRNAGGGVITGQVSSRQAWVMVESQQARFSLRRGEQHTVGFSVDARLLPTRGLHRGVLLWETDHGNHVTAIQIEVTPPINLDHADQTSAVTRPQDIIRLCDCLQGSPPHAWERGVALLGAGKIAAALRFLGEEALAVEAERLARDVDPNIGLETILRRLGARPPAKYMDNQRDVARHITGPLSKKPPEVLYGVLNTSQRGYMHGFVRPLVEWLAIPEPRFGCLPGQEGIVKILPDYARRASVPLFGGISLFEVVLE